MERTVRVATNILTVLILGAFAFLAIRGICSPLPASSRFGLPVSSADGELYFRVYLARNLVIVATATIFFVLRRWRPLATLVTVVILLPLFDMVLLLLEFGLRAPWPFHLSSACIISLLAALLWTRTRMDE